MTMKDQLRPSASIEDISGRAMLVGLTIKSFNPVKTDKKITAEVATAHGSEVSMGRYAKSVIDKSAIDELRCLAGEIRTEHYRRTLPWAEDGARILTSQGYNDYAAFMRESSDKWEAAVGRFLDGWDSFVRDARVKLNGLFNENDYPPAGKLRKKFAFRTTVRPVPVAEDFRVALGASEIGAIRAQINSDLAETVREVMMTVWVQMRDVVAKMAERLKAYDPQHPGAAPFRDSLVTNISDLLAILPSLNLTEDEAVKVFAGEMRGLTKFGAEELRDNRWKREDTAKRAEAILSQMEQFIA
jgi:hypothetical protein